jgi:Family of unknown function (DUF5677)
MRTCVRALGSLPPTVRTGSERVISAGVRTRTPISRSCSSATLCCVTQGDRVDYRKLHEREFESRHRLFGLVGDAAKQISGHRDSSTPDKIVVGIFMRSTNVWRAAGYLCGVGFGVEAGMLNRVLFEALADLAWTSMHPDEATELFPKNDEFAQLLIAEKASGFPQFDVEPLTQSQKERLAELKELFGDFGEKHWTRLSVHGRLQSSKDAFIREGEFAQVERWHAIAHFQHNQLLHGSPLALAHRVRELDADTTAFVFGPSDDWLSQALVAGAWTISMITLLALRHFAIPAAEDFWQAADAELTVLRASRPV